MNKPVVSSYEDAAIDVVVNVLNAAKCKVGVRLNLAQLAKSCNKFLPKTKVSLQTLENPILVKTCKTFLENTIDKTWHLKKTFKYVLGYMGSTMDETTFYFYYEAVFSQPSKSYPIPQATVSVFFRVENKHVERIEVTTVPQVIFCIEGQHTEHDVRYVSLTADWLLAVLKMKLKLYKRIESLRLF